MIDNIRQDLTLARRSLMRAPAVTAIAIVSLELGIAANTTIFSLVQAVEFPRLIYPEASRLIFLEARNTARGLTGMPVSAPDARDIAAASRTLERVSVTADQTSVVTVGNSAWRAGGRRVDPSFFETLRVAPALGRGFDAAEPPGVVVLSDSFWRSRLGADPGVLGRSIRMDGGMVTVVGIMPARFDPDADFWTPIEAAPAAARDDRQFTVFARLARGATLRDSERELAVQSDRMARAYPATNRDWRTEPVPVARMHGRDSRQTFLLLQAAVGFVLLIACANIANILLARGTDRRHEMAVRVSLGASRRRLIRALLSEAMVLAAAGGSLGVLLSLWGIQLARALGGFPDVIDPHMNILVLAFSAALSMATGVVCGIVPALRSSAVAPAAVMREAGRGWPGDSRGRLRAILAAGQVALALVLSTCALLMVRTVANRQAVNLGFEPRGAMRAEVAFAGARYRDLTAARTTVSTVLERVTRMPGVVAAGASTWALPTPAGAQRQLTAPTKQDLALPVSIRRGVEAVTPGYFDAQGIAVTSGRPFADSDQSGSAPVAIVNEELARHLWPDRDPVGELLRLGAAGESAPVVTVAGVVRTVRRSPMHDVPVARVYVPFAQYPNGTVTFVVRTTAGTLGGSRALEAALRETDPSLVLDDARSLEADVAQFVAPLRLLSALFAVFGGGGVLLAALGVFGTMSYTVSQRRRDIAVRTALGADRSDIVWLVLGSVARITAAGLAAGMILALVVTRALASFLFGVKPGDLSTYAVVGMLMVVISFGACYRPIRIAATVDPGSILR